MPAGRWCSGSRSPPGRRSTASGRRRGSAKEVAGFKRKSLILDSTLLAHPGRAASVRRRAHPFVVLSRAMKRKCDSATANNPIHYTVHILHLHPVGESRALARMTGPFGERGQGRQGHDDGGAKELHLPGVVVAAAAAAAASGVGSQKARMIRQGSGGGLLY